MPKHKRKMARHTLAKTIQMPTIILGVAILITSSLLFINILLDRKVTIGITKNLPQPAIPTPNQIIQKFSDKTDDWKRYAKTSSEPIITNSDKTEKFWSPNKTHYLLKIYPNKGETSSFAIYTSNGKFEFAFDPKTTKQALFSGIAKRFHDYWINDSQIAFLWSDEGYTGSNNAFFYNLEQKEFSLIDASYFDFDPTGGFLFTKRSDFNQTYTVEYKRDNETVHIGNIKGWVNGLSPSGKYIIFLITDTDASEKAWRENQNKSYSTVFVAPVVEDGIDKAIPVGKITQFYGGVEGLTDTPFAAWGIDEKNFTVRFWLTEEKNFPNPFVH